MTSPTTPSNERIAEIRRIIEHAAIVSKTWREQGTVITCPISFYDAQYLLAALDSRDAEIRRLRDACREVLYDLTHGNAALAKDKLDAALTSAGE